MLLKYIILLITYYGFCNDAICEFIEDFRDWMLMNIDDLHVYS